MSDKKRPENLAYLWIEEEKNEKIQKSYDNRRYFYELSSLIYNDPSEAWEVIKLISGAECPENVFDSFSMGPLSSFIFHNGLSFKNEIFRFWKENEKFKEQYKMVIFADLADELLR